MSDVQPKITTSQIVMGIGVVLFFIILAFALRPEPEAPEPVNVGRYQIVSQPSGVVLRIDTHDGKTSRLVIDPENGSYYWGVVSD